MSIPTDNERLPNITPGEVLREEFLNPLHITAYRLARAIDVPQTRVGEILRNQRRITATTALKLGAFFGTTPEFWINLQASYDLEEARRELGSTALGAIPRYDDSPARAA